MLQKCWLQDHTENHLRKSKLVLKLALVKIGSYLATLLKINTSLKTNSFTGKSPTTLDSQEIAGNSTYSGSLQSFIVDALSVAKGQVDQLLL